MEEIRFTPIGHIHTDFPDKFGIPRQSGLAKTRAFLTLEGDCRNPDVVRGITEFSHLWLLWGFSETLEQGWSPTVGCICHQVPFSPQSYRIVLRPAHRG